MKYIKVSNKEAYQLAASLSYLLVNGHRATEIEQPSFEVYKTLAGMIKTVGLTVNDVVVANVMTKRLNAQYRGSVAAHIALFGGLYVSQSLSYDEPLGKATWLQWFPFSVTWSQFVDVMLEYVEAAGWNMNLTAAEYNASYHELAMTFEMQQNGGTMAAAGTGNNNNTVTIVTNNTSTNNTNNVNNANMSTVMNKGVEFGAEEAMMDVEVEEDVFGGGGLQELVS